MKIKRKDVVEYVEAKQAYNYRCCENCKHYGKSIVCGECSRGRRFVFDWEQYYREHKLEVDAWVRETGLLDELFPRVWNTAWSRNYDKGVESARAYLMQQVEKKTIEKADADAIIADITEGKVRKV